jgi:hypothetical protein
MEDGIRVYHGSNVRFESPSLEKSRDRRDFGRGFYTTTVKEQAADWSKTLQLRFNGGAFVYEFELNNTAALNIKLFNGLNLEWLEFVKENRMKGGLQHNFDAVCGAVANDKTMQTITMYIDGLYTAEEALNRLRYMLPNDQISFHTEKGLASLTLIEVTEWKP